MIAPVNKWVEECRIDNSIDCVAFAKLVAKYCADTAAMSYTGLEAREYICMDFDLEVPDVECD